MIWWLLPGYYRTRSPLGSLYMPTWPSDLYMLASSTWASSERQHLILNFLESTAMNQNDLLYARHGYNSCTWEAQTWGELWVQGQPERHSENASKIKRYYLLLDVVVAIGNELRVEYREIWTLVKVNPKERLGIKSDHQDAFDFWNYWTLEICWMVSFGDMWTRPHCSHVQGMGQFPNLLQVAGLHWSPSLSQDHQVGSIAAHTPTQALGCLLHDFHTSFI